MLNITFVFIKIINQYKTKCCSCFNWQSFVNCTFITIHIPFTIYNNISSNKPCIEYLHTMQYINGNNLYLSSKKYCAEQFKRFN